MTRLAENEYLVVSGAGVTRRDLSWLDRHIDGDARAIVVDVTGQWAVFGVMGPGSRRRRRCRHRRGSLQRSVPVRCGPRRRDRLRGGPRGEVSYVGELGWELYAPADQAPTCIRPDPGGGRRVRSEARGGCTRSTRAGSRRSSCTSAMTSPTSTPRWRPACAGCAGWTSRRRSRARRNRAPARFEPAAAKRLLQFLLADPEPLLFGHEPFLRDGETVGYLTSGNYGHTLGGGVGLGYARHDDGVSRGSGWRAGPGRSLVEGERFPRRRRCARCTIRGARARGDAGRQANAAMRQGGGNGSEVAVPFPQVAGDRRPAPTSVDLQGQCGSVDVSREPAQSP